MKVIQEQEEKEVISGCVCFEILRGETGDNGHLLINWSNISLDMNLHNIK